MSILDELKNMLMSFRVAELQMLLGYAGQNKTGRKIELQTRALELLQQKNFLQSNIPAKIREIYKSIQNQMAVSNAAVDMQSMPAQSSAPPIITSSLTRSSYMQPGPPYSTGLYNMFNNFPQPSKPPPNPSVPQYAVQSDVTFKRLPFYEILGELLKPSTLAPNSMREAAGNFHFFLTPAQATEIAMNREVGPGTKNEYSVQVQMRFCLNETSCEQEDAFPPGLVVKVNGKPCHLPQGPVPINKPTAEPKRPPRPVNISALVKLTPTVSNHVVITWNHDYQRNTTYCVCIALVKKLTARDLLNRLKIKGARHADYTTGLIKEKLVEDPDSEIATTSLRVSLLCPLGKMRMSIPCRPVTCTHLQCFDASLFLQMNEKKPTWTCPVCDKLALYDNLVIDGYFQEVLSSRLLPSNSHEIQLHKDGSWSSHVPKSVVASLETTQDQDQVQEILEDSQESSDEGLGKELPPLKGEEVRGDTVTKKAGGDSTVKSEGSATSKSSGKVHFVDLTLSDTDDEADSGTKSEDSGKVPENGSTTEPSQPPRPVTDSCSTERSSPTVIMLDSPSPPLDSNQVQQHAAPSSLPRPSPSSSASSGIPPEPLSLPPMMSQTSHLSQILSSSTPSAFSQLIGQSTDPTTPPAPHQIPPASSPLAVPHILSSNPFNQPTSSCIYPSSLPPYRYHHPY